MDLEQTAIARVFPRKTNASPTDALAFFGQPTIENIADCIKAGVTEDTRLMPEEVLPKDKADEIALKLMRLADLESLCNYTRLRELAEADKDGRVVVLPCKVGQRVFALMDMDKHISECEVKQIGLGNEIGFIGLEPIGARGREYGVALKGFGKTVFLTREEAEKAMEVSG